MSPVGGVGINYAIQDVVVAANILTDPLKTGRLQESHFAEVHRQRELPTRVIQRFQNFLQTRLIAGALDSQVVANIPLPFKILLRCLLSAISRRGSSALACVACGSKPLDAVHRTNSPIPRLKCVPPLRPGFLYLEKQL
jgi:hypothetical protein